MFSIVWVFVFICWVELLAALWICWRPSEVSVPWFSRHGRRPQFEWSENTEADCSRCGRLCLGYEAWFLASSIRSLLIAKAAALGDKLSMGSWARLMASETQQNPLFSLNLASCLLFWSFFQPVFLNASVLCPFVLRLLLSPSCLHCVAQQPVCIAHVLRCQNKAESHNTVLSVSHLTLLFTLTAMEDKTALFGSACKLIGLLVNNYYNHSARRLLIEICFTTPERCWNSRAAGF